MQASDSLLEKVLVKLDQYLDQHINSQQDSNNDSYTYRWVHQRGAIPIHWDYELTPEDLLFVEKQATQLIQNTKQFLADIPANNALLWGSRGTGKSSLLQAILKIFCGESLHVIEINRDELYSWPALATWIAQQNQKFIIFCDDLSFDQNDASYKSVKAALDGSLISMPKNALIYATSNRRHLLPEFLADNQLAKHQAGEIHHNESVEEAISLSDRFGLWLAFHALTQNQYLDIVSHWIVKFGLDINADEYREEALRWALQRGSRSGRIANQFARNYVGRHFLAQQD